MKKKSLNVVIPLVVYPFDVMFSFGQTGSQLKRDVEKRGIEWDEKRFTYPGCGRCETFDSMNHTVIMLYRMPDGDEDYGTLQHEIFHAVYQILKSIGMSLSDDSEEAYAYLIGYLTEKIYEHL